MLPESATVVLLIVIPIIGFIFGMYWWWNLSKIKIAIPSDDGNVNDMDPRAPLNGNNQFLTAEIMTNVAIISERVSNGATTFLVSEYKYMLAILSAFGILLFVLLGVSMSNLKTEKYASPWVQSGLSVFSFVMGCVTSVGSGWIGMRIAVYANSRTAVMATEGAAEGDSARGFSAAFAVAFRGGITMGFCITCAGLLMLFVTVEVVRAYFDGLSRIEYPAATQQLYECVAAFGLGGSAIACFGRVGGGIFTKAADVGADLVGKVEKNIPEDDARNPGVIADCIGDNVGDIAGMGSDLFGSFGEASCSALVIASSSPELSADFTYMAFPLLITAVGIIVCIITSLFAAIKPNVKSAEDIEPCLKRQLVISTVLNTGALTGLAFMALPDFFHIPFHCTRIDALVCVLCGLWSGLLIGYTTEYFTSNTYRPVQEIAEACETGAATNIIYGLALGYLSVLPPILAMAVTIFVASKLCGLYGYALAALGILSTMAVGLTIDAYGPISDNAGGFAEMAHMGHEIREITDSLDAAGNTTAAIGKGFAISSAAFVGLALYGAFITRSQLVDDKGRPTVDILDERVLPGLLVGAMLPYLFFAMTMKSVGMAAMEMVNEIRRQFQNPEVAEGRQEPDYNACVQIATNASLRKMIAPGSLVMFTPIVVGILFGKHSLAGLLPGAIISGVQMAISSSNTGGAWDNAKKYIEKGGLKDPSKGKGSDYHAAAVIGDTVGDPLKDTSGPALNILIKLMAIISVVFSPVFNSSLGGVLMHLIDKEHHSPAPVPTGNWTHVPTHMTPVPTHLTQAPNHTKSFF